MGGSRPIYSRRPRRPRYVLIGTLLSIPILLAIGVIRACQGGPSLDAKGYVDSVRPLIQKSKEIGDAFRALPQGVDSFTRSSLTSKLDGFVTDSKALLDRASTEFPNGIPTFALNAHGYLLTALRARADGMNDVKPAILSASVNPDEAFAISTFQTALTALVLSDEAFQYFTDEIQAQLDKAKQKSEVPDSSYVRNTDLGRPEKQADFVRALRTSPGLQAAQNLSIVEFKTEPDSVGQSGDVFGLPPSDYFEVRITIANKGNVKVEQIQVRAELTSQLNPTPQTDSYTLDLLEAGDTKVAVLRGLRPDRGDPVNLIKMQVVAPEDVDQIDNERSFKFTMRKS